jgi:hypothetical protein
MKSYICNEKSQFIYFLSGLFLCLIVSFFLTGEIWPTTVKKKKKMKKRSEFEGFFSHHICILFFFIV